MEEEVIDFNPLDDLQQLGIAAGMHSGSHLLTNTECVCRQSQCNVLECLDRKALLCTQHKLVTFIESSLSEWEAASILPLHSQSQTHVFLAPPSLG